MKFYGSDSEISLDRNGEREFSAFTWLPLEEIAAQVTSLNKAGLIECMCSGWCAVSIRGIACWPGWYASRLMSSL